jgi:hypothetical protein
LRTLTRVRDELRRKKVVQGRRFRPQPQPQIVAGGGGGGTGGGGIVQIATTGGIKMAPGSQISAGSVNITGNVTGAGSQRSATGNAHASRVPPMPVIASGGGGGDGGFSHWGNKQLQVSGGAGGTGGAGPGVPVVARDSPLWGENEAETRIDPLEIDGEICARCGTFWKPNAQGEADSLKDEIRKLRLEVESAVDLLGRVSENE